jgi:anti-sigma-K factor RskA
MAEGRSGRRRARRAATVAAVAVAAVAAVAVVAVVLGVQVDHLHHQVSSLQSRSPLSAAEQSVLADPSTTKVRLAASTSSDHPPVGAVTVLLTRSGTGFVEARGLSSLPSDQTYQLWGVIGDQTISLGLLGSRPDVTPFTVAGNTAVSAFAITAERAGGVEHSSHQPVVAGDVAA